VADSEPKTAVRHNPLEDNKVDTADGADGDFGPISEYREDDGLDFPDSLRRPPPDATCAECKDDGGVLEPDRANGRLEWLHPKCRDYRRGKAAMARNRRPLTAPGRSAPRAPSSPDSGDAMTAHKAASEQ
jgi:hypothetical protein